MEGLKVLLTVIYIIACVALTIIVLLQEGKSAGLGAISGAAETYWGRNKGRSMEGKLEKVTKYLVMVFLVFAIILNLPFMSGKASDSKTTSSPAPTVQQSKDATGGSVSDTSAQPGSVSDAAAE